MDDPDHIAYVASAMNLLLLLSALLSALTGAGIGGRRSEIAQTVTAQAVVGQAGRVVTAKPARRPVAALPTLASIATISPAIIPVLFASIDIWATRRRE